MYELSREVLKDLTTCIEELDFVVKQSFNTDDLLIERHLRDAEDGSLERDGALDIGLYGHEVLAIEAVDGHAYFVDLSGAHIGERRSLIPFDEYKDLWVKVPIYLHTHGHWANELRESREGRRSDNKYSYTCAQVEHKVQQRMMASIRCWERRNRATLQQLICGPRQAYERGKAAVLNKSFDEMTLVAKEWMQERALLEPPMESKLMPWPGLGPTCTVTSTEQMSRALDMWNNRWTASRKAAEERKARERARTAGAIYGDVEQFRMM